MRPSTIRTLCLLLLALCSLASTITPATAAQEPLPPATTQSSEDGHIGLPKGCGGVTPGGEPIRSCCISGYVWMDGQAVNGAEVTITAAKNGNSLTLITDLQEDATQPYYYTALSGAPLDIVAGDLITVTARYSSHEQSVSYTAKAGGQQVDVVLSKNFREDYMYEKQTKGVQEEGKFNQPESIDNDSNGNLYVLDREASTVQKFDRNGVFILKWGERGRGHTQFLYPKRLYVDRSNNVYVVDTGNDRITKFSSSGDFIQQFGTSGKGPGLLSKPQDVVVDSQSILYIADYLGVHTFNSDGRFINTWPSVKPTNDYNPPIYHLAIDSSDHIIGYTYNPSISIFSTNGTLIGSWDGRYSVTVQGV